MICFEFLGDYTLHKQQQIQYSCHIFYIITKFWNYLRGFQRWWFFPPLFKKKASDPDLSGRCPSSVVYFTSTNVPVDFFYELHSAKFYNSKYFDIGVVLLYSQLDCRQLLQIENWRAIFFVQYTIVNFMRLIFCFVWYGKNYTIFLSKNI